mmetsp:Transcript_4173/g.17125  ORF Transcript_4173/g.17125 Transcript_4173/m.17125 type:complete len:226 (+) Transcript_4173:1776-2453(+)
MPATTAALRAVRSSAVPTLEAGRAVLGRFIADASAMRAAAYASPPAPPYPTGSPEIPSGSPTRKSPGICPTRRPIRSAPRADAIRSTACNAVSVGAPPFTRTRSARDDPTAVAARLCCCRIVGKLESGASFFANASRGFEVGCTTSLGSCSPNVSAFIRAARERRMPAVSGLRVWFTVRHRSISSTRSGEKAAPLFTGGYFPFRILTKRAPWFWALNGCDPVIIS